MCRLTMKDEVEDEPSSYASEIKLQKPSTMKYYLGMIVAAAFSLIYFLAPMYILTSTIALVTQYPSRYASMLYAAPLIISILIPSKGVPSLGEPLKVMLHYFDYDEVHETSNEVLQKAVDEDNKKFIFACQPHGVVSEVYSTFSIQEFAPKEYYNLLTIVIIIRYHYFQVSFVGFCSWINAPKSFRTLKTAVASALLNVPILKHVLGIFSLTDASGPNVRHILQHGRGIDGCLVLYIGGIAELFKSSRKEERLYLKKRKGFIKVAMREGADIIPIYLFGNTSVLTVMKSGPLAKLSRKLQVSLTYFWGKFYLPIPRNDKVRSIELKCNFCNIV